MKTVFYAMFVLCVAMNGCASHESVPEGQVFELGIDVQASFNGEHVIVSLDNEELINNNLETNNALGVCLGDGQVKTHQFEGNHVLKVTVNQRITKTEIFVLEKPHYIGIKFDPTTREITFDHADQPFGYD